MTNDLSLLRTNDSFCVPMEGLEPPYLAASDPKSDVSANFTTWALRAAKVMDLMETITHRIPNLLYKSSGYSEGQLRRRPGSRRIFS